MNTSPQTFEALMNARSADTARSVRRHHDRTRPTAQRKTARSFLPRLVAAALPTRN